MADTAEDPAGRISRGPVTRLLLRCDSRADPGGAQHAGTTVTRALTTVSFTRSS
ncbi:hypothetical protein QFZ66_008236 [Streptomyces sp. B4I13]|nr:hypothetical protein [Streptomyces sp. B4I13]